GGVRRAGASGSGARRGAVRAPGGGGVVARGQGRRKESRSKGKRTSPRGPRRAVAAVCRGRRRRYGIRRSLDPDTFQGLPERSVTPELSVTTTGNPAPAIDPVETMLGLAVIVITTSLLVPPVPFCNTHVAFVPQAMSATL